MAGLSALASPEPIVLASPRVMGIVAGIVSGLGVRYVVAGRPHPRPRGWPSPGHRFPDGTVHGGDGLRLHQLLDGRGFHLFCFGEDIDPLALDLNGLDDIKVHRLDVRTLDSTDEGRRACLVRPDGYIAKWLEAWTRTPELAGLTDQRCGLQLQ